MTDLVIFCPCGICKGNVREKSKCIECTACLKWVHFSCTNLDKVEFRKHVNDPTLSWRCLRCKVYRCNKCVKVIGRTQNKVRCTCCKEWYHMKCAGININVAINEMPMCYACKSENIPFSNVSDSVMVSCFQGERLCWMQSIL